MLMMIDDKDGYAFYTRTTMCWLSGFLQLPYVIMGRIKHGCAALPDQRTGSHTVPSRQWYSTDLLYKTASVKWNNTRE